MEFSYVELGFCNTGDKIEVSFSTAANICLLTPQNFYAYSNGKAFEYYGGYMYLSPAKFVIPYAGKWYITVDLADYGGMVSYTVSVLRNDVTHTSESCRNTSTKNIDDLRWDIQDENPDCKVMVMSDWCKKHPEWGDPNLPRTDFLVFDKKYGNLHKHYAIGEFNGWKLEQLHSWKK